MGTTPTYALPYPELTDQANVPADMKELADAVEATFAASAAGTRPFCSRKKSTGQALTVASTYYTMLFETQDAADGISYSNGIFTVTRAGLYQINTVLLFQGSVVTQARLRLLVNGGQVIEAVFAGGPSVNNAISASRAVRMNAADTFSVAGWASTTGITVSGSAVPYSYLDATFIGP